MNWDERYSEPGFAYGTAPNEFLVSVWNRRTTIVRYVDVSR